MTDTNLLPITMDAASSKLMGTALKDALGNTTEASFANWMLNGADTSQLLTGLENATLNGMIKDPLAATAVNLGIQAYNGADVTGSLESLAAKAVVSQLPMNAEFQKLAEAALTGFNPMAMSIAFAPEMGQILGSLLGFGQNSSLTKSDNNGVTTVNDNGKVSYIDDATGKSYPSMKALDFYKAVDSTTAQGYPANVAQMIVAAQQNLLPQSAIDQVTAQTKSMPSYMNNSIDNAIKWAYALGTPDATTPEAQQVKSFFTNTINSYDLSSKENQQALVNTIKNNFGGLPKQYQQQVTDLFTAAQAKTNAAFKAKDPGIAAIVDQYSAPGAKSPALGTLDSLVMAQFLGAPQSTMDKLLAFYQQVNGSKPIAITDPQAATIAALGNATLDQKLLGTPNQPISDQVALEQIYATNTDAATKAKLLAIEQQTMQTREANAIADAATKSVQNSQVTAQLDQQATAIAATQAQQTSTLAGQQAATAAAAQIATQKQQDLQTQMTAAGAPNASTLAADQQKALTAAEANLPAEAFGNMTPAQWAQLSPTDQQQFLDKVKQNYGTKDSPKVTPWAMASTQANQIGQAATAQYNANLAAEEQAFVTKVNIDNPNLQANQDAFAASMQAYMNSVINPAAVPTTNTSYFVPQPPTGIPADFLPPDLNLAENSRLKFLLGVSSTPADALTELKNEGFTVGSQQQTMASAYTPTPVAAPVSGGYMSWEQTQANAPASAPIQTVDQQNAATVQNDENARLKFLLSISSPQSALSELTSEGFTVGPAQQTMADAYAPSLSAMSKPPAAAPLVAPIA